MIFSSLYITTLWRGVTFRRVFVILALLVAEEVLRHQGSSKMMDATLKLLDSCTTNKVLLIAAGK
jgi:hypothetical protein